MNSKIKKIILNKNLFLYLLITLMFFGIFFKIEYATDTYATFSFTLKEFIYQFISSGRFMLIVFGGVLKILKIKAELAYSLSFILAIICMITSLYKLYFIIKDDIKSEKLKIIIPIVTVINAFSIELFLFVEKGVMIFAIAMCIFAVGSMKKFFESKNKKYLIATLILMLLANFSYQGVVGIFVSILLVFILKYSKNIKEFIINNVIVAICYGIPAIIDYSLIKILFSGSRVSGEFIFSQSLSKIFSGTKYMIAQTYGILPKYFLLTLIAITILMIIYEIVIQGKSTKLKVIEILKIAYILLGTILVSIAPQFMQNTSSIWVVARSTYTYASLYGILVLYLFMNYKTDKNIEYITIILSIILLIVQFYRFNTIETDRYKLNAIDYEITRKIYAKINDYENKAGNEITQIAIYDDNGKSYTYEGIFATGDTNIKAYSIDWSIQYIINYYYGKKLKIVERDARI